MMKGGEGTEFCGLSPLSCFLEAADLWRRTGSIGGRTERGQNRAVFTDLYTEAVNISYVRTSAQWELVQHFTISCKNALPKFDHLK